MILSPDEARDPKIAIDEVSPGFRQGQRDSTHPQILIFEAGGIQYVVADGDGEVFGMGHLMQDDWWFFSSEDAGKSSGAVIKRWSEVLEKTGRSLFSGYIHFFRPKLTVASGGANPFSESRMFFKSYPGEYSAFYPVMFQKNKGGHVWRAAPRLARSSQAQLSNPAVRIR